jgi:Xaa-Pro dipeptidase
MPLHFSREELATRREQVCFSLEQANLYGILIFRQESMFYLTGYDSFGYVFFQCLYLGVNGDLFLLTRSADLRQAQQTSMITDIRIWTDGFGANPAEELRETLREFGCAGKSLGVEYDAYGLTAANGKRLEQALRNFCVLEDASLLVSQLRVVKSPAELSYVRRAAELADDALDEAFRILEPGTDEGELLAVMQGAIFRGGGDYPGNEFIIGSGAQALLCRYSTGRRQLDPEDQLTLEWAGVYRHYHAAMMRTIPVGRATARHRLMHEVCVAALEACEAALVPGNPVGAVFDAYAQTCDAAGMREHRLNATGYSLGTTFAPNWMDWPMFYHGNPVVAEPNMVFFLHMILMDSAAHQAMSLGHTVVVTESGCERLSRHPLDLVVC